MWYHWLVTIWSVFVIIIAIYRMVTGKIRGVYVWIGTGIGIAFAIWLAWWGIRGIQAPTYEMTSTATMGGFRRRGRR